MFSLFISSIASVCKIKFKESFDWIFQLASILSQNIKFPNVFLFLLQDELNKMKSINKESRDEKQSMDFELQKYKDMYEAEQKLREKLARRLEKASDKAAKAQL